MNLAVICNSTPLHKQFCYLPVMGYCGLLALSMVTYFAFFCRNMLFCLHPEIKSSRSESILIVLAEERSIHMHSQVEPRSQQILKFVILQKEASNAVKSQKIDCTSCLYDRPPIIRTMSSIGTMKAINVTSQKIYCTHCS